MYTLCNLHAGTGHWHCGTFLQKKFFVNNFTYLTYCTYRGGLSKLHMTEQVCTSAQIYKSAPYITVLIYKSAQQNGADKCKTAQHICADMQIFIPKRCGFVHLHKPINLHNISMRRYKYAQQNGAKFKSAQT